MAYNTDNLNLFCYDPDIDSDNVFSIEQALNDNWGIIDSTYYNLNDILTSLSSTVSSHTTSINTLNNRIYLNAASKDSNGYFRFSNNCVVMWIKTSDYSIAASTTKEVTLTQPIAAKVIRWAVVSNDWITSCSISSPNTSQITLKIRNTGGSKHDGIAVELIGVGYIS